MQITLVGPGRLGRSLDVLWRRAGHAVSLVGRGDALPPHADVVVLTVPDRQIAPVAEAIPPGALVLHTSGATDLGPVAHHARHGSLHPLMTFPGIEHGLPDLTGVPAAIAASDPATRHTLEQLARDLGLRPVHVPGDRRLYHAAAVIAGNFATTLLAEAGHVLAHAGLDPADARAMLAPLAMRSLHNAIVDPAGALTGPIARGDRAVVEAHQQALSASSLHDARNIYDAMAIATAHWAAGSHDLDA